jgi:hypothetical protein
MVDMVQADIACEPLRYFGELVKRTPFQRRVHWFPVLMTTPVAPFELVLNVERTHTNNRQGLGILIAAFAEIESGSAYFYFKLIWAVFRKIS